MKSVNTHKLSVELPAKLVDLIDVLAARELLSRTAWIRRVILAALRAEGSLDQPVAAPASTYSTEMARLFG